MKRWIHSNKSASLVSSANKQLALYDAEKVDYVQECYDEVVKAISDSFVEDEDGYLDQVPVGSTISEIKRDYLVGALEDDLMTEEEFNTIYDLIDTAAIGNAEAAI